MKMNLIGMLVSVAIQMVSCTNQPEPQLIEVTYASSCEIVVAGRAWLDVPYPYYAWALLMSIA